MENWIRKIIEDKVEILTSDNLAAYVEEVENVGKILSKALKNEKKVLIAGNGGSAADAQHFAAEIVGRFLKERSSLPAISLCTDPSIVTSISNDYGYDDVFARQIEGLGNEGDCFIGISTSGNSKNISRAIEVAKAKNICTVGLLGKDGGKIKSECDIALVVPSGSTPRIQEIHTFSVHLLCEIVERNLFD